MDYLSSGPTYTPTRTNTAAIATATTTTVVASPGASTQRNVRNLNIANADAANSTAITVKHTDGTNSETLFNCTLLPGEELVFTQGGQWLHFDKFGGIYQAVTQVPVLFNHSTSTVSAGYAADTYLAGSNILLPSSRPKAGTKYLCRFDMTKTGAGVATPIITLRYGTNATTADTALLTFTFAAGTAAADTGYFEVEVDFRSIGSGTSAVAQGVASVTTNLTTTGLTNAKKAVVVLSGGFDSTTANTYFGASFNGGTSFSGTCQQVTAELRNF